MSKLCTAQWETVPEMRECQMPGCGCYTTQGYFVQHHTAQSSYMLFLCEECFESKYRSQCRLGLIDKSRYLRDADVSPYTLQSPKMRKMIKSIRMVTKIMRASIITVACLLMGAWFLQGRHELRITVKEPTMQNEIHADINKDLNFVPHFEINDTGNISDQMDNILYRFETVLKHGGNIYD